MKYLNKNWKSNSAKILETFSNIIKIIKKHFLQIILLFIVCFVFTSLYTFYFIDIFIHNNNFISYIIKFPIFNFSDNFKFKIFFNLLILIAVLLIIYLKWEFIKEFIRKFIVSFFIFGPIYKHFYVFLLLMIFNSLFLFKSFFLQSMFIFNGDYVLISDVIILIIIFIIFTNKENTLMSTSSRILRIGDDKFSPIVESNQDLLGYKDKALEIVEKLIEPTKGLIIQYTLIAGKWGIGKTSLLNLVYNNLIKRIELEKRKYNCNRFTTDFADEQKSSIPLVNIRQIQFKLSSFSELEKIETHFYNHILNTLKQYSFLPLIRKEIFFYSLSSIYSEKLDFTKLFGKLLTTDIYEYLQVLDKLISELNLKLVIYIDDVDRLNNSSEVQFVLKLIRLTKSHLSNIHVFVCSDLEKLKIFLENSNE